MGNNYWTKMYHILIFLSLFFNFNNSLKCQNNSYGFYIGPSMATQKWSYGRDPLFTWHADAYMDSQSSDGMNALYGMIGCHVKGGAIRYSGTSINGVRYPGHSFGMRFYNASLEIGLKKFLKKKEYSPYYAIGLHGDYTFKSKFDFNQEIKDFVKPFTAGFSLHAGTDFAISKFVRGGVDLHIGPDFTKQVYIPPGTRWYDPYSGSVSSSIEQSVRNLVVELSFTMRFIQIIVYE